MTEEVVETPEQNGAPGTQVDTSIPKMDIPDTVIPSLGAKPDAVDIYRNIVSNPYTQSNPITKTTPVLDDSEFINNLSRTVQKKANALDNPHFNMRPYTYNGDYDGANFERYYGTDAYKTLGFSPYRDNETLYNDKLSLGDQFVRSASQWPSLFKTGLMSGVKSWGDMFTDPLAPDIESARDMQRSMAIGSSGSGGVSGFLTNTFLNSAYTVGIGMEMLGETLILAGLTAATGGADVEATLPAWLSRIGVGGAKVAEGLEASAGIARAAEASNEALKTFKGLKTVSDARSFWNTLPGKGLSSIAKTINPLENTFEALKATDYASSYAKAVNTFGGFAKDVVATHAAVSEAKLEGGMVKLDVTRNLIDEYRRTHAGRDPEGEDLQKIENLATQEALTTGLWNLPAIMWSNKFMYETMLAPIEKLVKPNTAKLVGDQVFEDGVFKAVGEGFIDRTRVAAKALTNPRVYGRYGMNYLKANLAEGIQENLQEAISSGAVKHSMDVYKDPGKGAYEGYLGYFMNGLKNQFSAQGAETFAGGFVMGMFAQPIMSAPSMTLSKILDVTVNKNRIAEYKAARDAQRQKDTQALNDLYKNINVAFAPDINNAIRQGHLSDDLYTAAKEGKQKEAVDAKDTSVFEHIYTALKTGHYDVFVNKLKDYKNFTAEEAKDAFKDVGVVNGTEALAHIDKVVKRAEQIRTNYENTANEFPNPFNPKQYSKTSPLYRANIIGYHAWEEAKKNLIFAKSSYERHGERMAELAANLSRLTAGIAGADAHSVLAMLDPRTTQAELATLKSEISVIDTAVPGNSRLKAEKQKQLDHLEEFYKAVIEHNTNALDKERNDLLGLKDKEISKKYKQTDTVAYRAFKKYLKYLGGKTSKIVFDKDIDEAYSMVKDHMRLKDESQHLAKNINLLSNPKGFLKLQHRMQVANTELIDQLPSILESNSKIFTSHKEAAAALDLLDRRFGLIVTPEFAELLGEAMRTDSVIPTPTEFIDPSTGKKVTSGDRFDQAVEAWKAHAELIGKTVEEPVSEKKEEAAPSTTTVTPTEDVSRIIPTDISTFPAALMKELDEELAIIKGYDPDATIGELYKTDPAMIMIINHFITSRGGTVTIETPTPEPETKAESETKPEFAEAKGVSGAEAAEFNKKTIPEKFSAIVSELKPGEQISGIFDDKYPGVREGMANQITLTDGRVLRTVFMGPLQRIAPIGEVVTIRKETQQVEGETRTVLKVYSKGTPLTYVRENTPTEETQTKGEPTVEDINRDINSDNLKVAMERGYEVIYDSLDNPDMAGRYLVKRVSKKSVTLSRPGTSDIKIPMDSVSSVIKEIIKPEELKVSEESPAIINGNETVVKDAEDVIEDKPVDQAADDFFNEIC